MRIALCCGRDVMHDDALAVHGGRGQLLARAGDWITEDLVSGGFRVWTDANFHEIHDPSPFANRSEV